MTCVSPSARSTRQVCRNHCRNLFACDHRARQPYGSSASACPARTLQNKFDEPSPRPWHPCLSAMSTASGSQRPNVTALGFSSHRHSAGEVLKFVTVMVSYAVFWYMYRVGWLHHDLCLAIWCTCLDKFLQCCVETQPSLPSPILYRYRQFKFIHCYKASLARFLEDIGVCNLNSISCKCNIQP